VADYGRATQLLPFKGGLMDGAAIDPDQSARSRACPRRSALWAARRDRGLADQRACAHARRAARRLAVALGQVREKKESGEISRGRAPAAEAPVVEEAPEDKVEPDQPAQDDNQADASADEAKTADENPKED